MQVKICAETGGLKPADVHIIIGEVIIVWFGNNIPGEPLFGGIYPAANDFGAMHLARLDGKGGASFYEHFFIRSPDEKIFR